jgi:hypothetical protein
MRSNLYGLPLPVQFVVHTGDLLVDALPLNCGLAVEPRMSITHVLGGACDGPMV